MTDQAMALLKDLSNKLKELSTFQQQYQAHDVDTKSLQKYLQMLDEQYGQEMIEKIDYLQNPILTEGELHLNLNGRYEVNGWELTKGDYIEIFMDDAFYVTHLDYAGQYAGGYYAFHFPNLPLEGVKVRIRKNSKVK